GFKRYLKERKLEISSTPEEESTNNFVHRYPITTENGEIAGSVVLDPEEGVISLEDRQEQTEQTIDEIMVSHGLGGGSAQDAEDPAFLLLGEHDGLSDTIMLVKPSRRTVSMIGIPRDLYFQGKKINELYLQRGPKGMMSIVSEITGVEVDHYVTIDTDGFSDLVDALGAVTVELETELLDPNMHYPAEGEMRMLYFSAGKHKIKGDAALALVRSRSTTSDFSRARRQQLVLEGIRNRADQLSLSDAGKLYNLVQTIIEYTDTDLGIKNMLRYYRRYRDVQDTRHLVLSSDNILYSTYLGLHNRDMDLQQADELEKEKLGAWILLPKYNDWDLIPWYVHTWLSGIEPDMEDIEPEENTEQDAREVDQDAEETSEQASASIDTTLLMNIMKKLEEENS
ncbi:MAG: LCP family protein, partial [Spirochaetia bacterium]